MLNMNRVTLLGHAGRDPEIRTIKSGDRDRQLQSGHHRKVAAQGRRDG